MMALMTPIVKAFMTDNGFQCASDCMQVFGGHGYIRANGMEQFVRDARINMIYEGTNAIQSLDLIGRKVLMDNGARLRTFGKMVTEFIEDNGTNPDMNEFVTPLADIGDKVQKLTMELGMKAMANRDEVGAAAVPYLRVVGHLVYSYFWARMAQDRARPREGRRRQGRSLLPPQADGRALLLPEAAAGDRNADPPRALGLGDADGDARRGLLSARLDWRQAVGKRMIGKK